MDLGRDQTKDKTFSRRKELQWFKGAGPLGIVLELTQVIVE
jgi:hypothetical protein